MESALADALAKCDCKILAVEGLSEVRLLSTRSSPKEDTRQFISPPWRMLVRAGSWKGY